MQKVIRRRPSGINGKSLRMKRLSISATSSPWIVFFCSFRMPNDSNTVFKYRKGEKKKSVLHAACDRIKVMI